jgi:branched-chain amino acid transport system substrate-binding protein
MMRFPKALVIVLSLFFMAIMAGTLGAADTIKIGVLSPLNHPVGEAQVNAAKMAVEAINKAGGVNGKQVEMIVGNTELNPEKAINALKKLVMVERVQCCVGVMSSGVVLSLMDHFARFKIPFIASGSASAAITDAVGENYDKYKYVFRIMVDEVYSAESGVDLVLNYLRPKLNVKKIAIMAEDAKWTTLQSDIVIKGVKKGGITVADYVRFSLKEMDFAPILTRVKNAEVDFLYEISAIMDGAVYINQWYDLQGPPIGGCDTSAGSAEFWEKTNGKCLSEIVYMYGSYPVDLTATTRQFWFDSIKRYKIEPKYTSGFTYDAVMVLAEAIKKGKSTKPDEIVKALENTSYTGVSGLIEFNKKNHNVIYGKGRPTQIWFQWHKKKRVPIYPKEYAEKELILPKWWKPKK